MRFHARGGLERARFERCDAAIEAFSQHGGCVVAQVLDGGAACVLRTNILSI